MFKSVLGYYLSKGVPGYYLSKIVLGYYLSKSVLGYPFRYEKINFVRMCCKSAEILAGVRDTRSEIFLQSHSWFSSY